jgi:hypothetical protein
MDKSSSPDELIATQKAQQAKLDAALEEVEELGKKLAFKLDAMGRTIEQIVTSLTRAGFFAKPEPGPQSKGTGENRGEVIPERKE